MTVDLRKLNSVTKYPSILTYHEIGEKGRLTEAMTEPAPGEAEGPLFVYEKVDGENARMIFVRTASGEIDYFIGSREELLYAKGDRLAIPTGNIAELLKPLAEKLANVFAGSEYADAKLSVMVVYQESYGGKTNASKNYSNQRAQHYRFFDVFTLTDEKFAEVMALSLEQIAMWREKSGQPFFSEAEKTRFAQGNQLDWAPLLDTVQALPTSVGDTYAFLKNFAKTQVAIDGEGGKSEGVIVRNAERSVIKKVRFEDYERTLRGR